MIESELKSLKIDPAKKQSRPRRNGLIVIVGMLLIAIALILFAYRGRSDSPAVSPEAGRANAPVETENSDSEIFIVSGYVVAHHKIQIGSKVMGKVHWIGVEKGDAVKKGQLLVKLDDREYRAQAEEAEAAERAAQARLKELEAGLRPEEIRRAAAELEGARAQYENASADLRRLEQLRDRGVSSEKMVDDARARLRVAQAALEVTQKNYELAQNSPRVEQIELARAEVDRAQARLKHSLVLLEATEIRAPIDGTILQRLVEVGEMVTTSFAGETGAKSAVVALADLTDLQVELDVSQADFKRLMGEFDCVMAPEAYPDRKYACVLAEIAPEANRQKATIQVKVKIMNPDYFLRPEMNARVTFNRRRS
ncbi:MAG: efflux RND transporter periplasmic adaptor subunit [Acidobacteria bacterium]|nr:efflux RND transporter periplasmic adaptor subunit [Acidobacteriota bacterium]